MARFWYLLFIFVATSISGQVTFKIIDPNACNDENGEPGDCTGLMDCPQTAARLKRPTPADFQYFDTIRCGFDKQRNPKVCCPKPKKMEALYDKNLWPDPFLCKTYDFFRIINGNNTALGEYPFMVRLSRGASFHCGGSLINQRYVITAAHCANNVSIVQLGEWNIVTEKDCEEGRCADPPKLVAVENITIHENYNSNNYSHDIALIRLAETINYTDWITPVCLPHPDYQLNQDLVGSEVTVSGWGYIDRMLPIKSDILMKAPLTVYNRSACEKAYETTLHNPEQICVGSDVGKDSCKGDSGGPATIVEDGLPTYNLLVGLVSIGHIECGSLHFPAIYTNVSAYIPWIYEHVKP